MNVPALAAAPERFGRYLLYPAIASGGMATVHTARLVGAEGFTRLVAAKRLHPQFADDADFVAMLHDEARIASQIHHPNVVPVLDVVHSGHELILIMDYVHGVPLAQLLKRALVEDVPVPVDIAVAVLAGILAGLHAAHEVIDEAGRPLEIVHRDVSPQNVMVSVDGIPRLLDFGIAKATTSTHHTQEGVFKGKLAYMAPEQLLAEKMDRGIDIYATGVLAWEMLVNRRIHDGRREIAFVQAVMNGELPSVIAALGDTRRERGDVRWRQLSALAPIVARAMAPRREDRFDTAADMMLALLAARPPASAMAVAEWVYATGADYLAQRQKTLADNRESWPRTSLSCPTRTSGTQRAQAAVGGARQILDAPAGVGLVPRAVRSSPPASNMPPPAVPHVPSGAHGITRRVSPVARVAPQASGRRGLLWMAACTTVAAVLLGALLRGADGVDGTSWVAPSTIRATAAPTPAAPESVVTRPALTSAVTFVRLTRGGPAPTTPRRAPIPPPASPPAVPSVSTHVAARPECRPPSSLEGSTNVLTPNCR